MQLSHTMFEFLLVSNKMLTAKHTCIHTKYKLCMEKYLRLKQSLKDSEKKNKDLLRKIHHLEQLNTIETIDKYTSTNTDEDTTTTEDHYELV